MAYTKRTKPLSDEQMQKLKTIQDQCLTMADNLEKIMTLELTKADVARLMGITPQQFNQNLASSFIPYFRAQELLTKEDIETLITDSESPMERLSKALLDINHSIPIYIDLAQEEAFMVKMEECLTSRELEIIYRRFGFKDYERQTLEEAGSVFKVSRDRIRQIEVKALRKLRHPNCMNVLFFQHQNVVTAFDQLEDTRILQERIKHSLAPLNFSVRTYNVLVRAGINTIEQLIETPFHKLEKFRNMGRKSLIEVITKLRDVCGVITKEAQEWLEKNDNSY